MARWCWLAGVMGAWCASAQAEIAASPHPVPLPASVWMGLTLFASFGVASLARRRRGRPRH